MLQIELITFVIGISTLVAITTFDSAAKTAYRDAIVNDLNTLASEAQDYYLRPGRLSGGGRTFSGFIINGKLMPADGISETADLAQTENCTIEISATSANDLTLIAHPSSCEGYVPGSIDLKGLLTNPGTCGENDQIGATVESGDIIFGESCRAIPFSLLLSLPGQGE